MFLRRKSEGKLEEDITSRVKGVLEKTTLHLERMLLMSLEITAEVENESLNNLLSSNKLMSNEYFLENIDRERLIKDKIEAWRANNGNETKSIRFIVKNNYLQGLYVLERLDWDSRVFDKNIWGMELIVNSNLLDDITMLKSDLISECARNNINHVACRIHSRDYDGTKILEGLGFKIVDSMIRFGLDFKKSEQIYNIKTTQ